MEPIDKTYVTDDDMIEVQRFLLEKCTDHTSITVQHAGRFRLKITTTMVNKRVSHFNLAVMSDQTPGQWAVTIAKQINEPLASRPERPWCAA